MSEKTQDNLEDIKREIVIERLRQIPTTVKISFGRDKGEFMNRDDMIRQVEGNTELGRKIIHVQLDYLKAFKNIALLEA